MAEYEKEFFKWGSWYFKIAVIGTAISLAAFLIATAIAISKKTPSLPKPPRYGLSFI